VIDGLVAGLRPGTPDNAPVLGPSAVDGLQWATGHYRHGILLAPITADVLAGSLAGEPLAEIAAQFGAERFAGVAVGA
jgi:glycine oxidase